MSLFVRATIVGLLLITSAVQGQDNSSSLKFVPGDVGFYVSMMKMRKQVELFLSSKAARRVQDLPLVQLAIDQYHKQWDDPQDAQLKAYKTVLEMPENKQLIELLIDAGSHEAFFYGDNSFSEVIALLNRINALSQRARMEAIANGQKPEDVIPGRTIREVAAIADKLIVPDFVMGFKLSEAKPAADQLARLEGILGFVLNQQQPKFRDRLKRQKIGSSEYLTFQFQGTDIPWDEVTSKIPEEMRADFDKVSSVLQKRTLSIAMGVYQDYVLISIGDNFAHLEKLGSGLLLADRAELAPLKKLGDKEFTSISFASGELIRMSQQNQQQQLDDVVDVVNNALPATIGQEARKELMDDVRGLRDYIVKLIPESGAVSSFTWLSNRGLTGYTYQWAGGKSISGDKRLSILDHTGGALAFFAARAKAKPEDHDFAIKFLERAIYHSEKIGLPQLQASDREMYEQLKRELSPLIVRWRETVRGKIIPALGDGQTALVFDARTTSTQWHQELPVSSKPLPMPEIALVFGVSDAEKLKQGVRESVEIAQEVIARLHKLFPEKVPDIKLPAAEKREISGGVVYYFVLPPEAGLDKQIAPNAGLGKDVAILSLIPNQTSRLLETETPSFAGPLSRAGDPLAGAAYVNFAGVMGAVKPWVEYAFELAEKESAADPKINAAKEPVRVILDVLSCVREFSAITYSEGAAAVSHFEWHIQDLE